MIGAHVSQDPRAISLSPNRLRQVSKSRPLLAQVSQVQPEATLLAKAPVDDGNASLASSDDHLDVTEPVLAIKFKTESDPIAVTNADDSLLPYGISDYTFVPAEAGGLLGRGKFSSVSIASKGDKHYAVKHTPLFPHHPLIASRLLREPTILAQLPAHPNLIRVIETIRTPGHFYLVEEFLENYMSLEDFVRTFANEILPDEIALTFLCQLIEVVRSALHRPIFVCHRDIKPENLLVHPQTHHLVILDFGLATHYSEREAKLTTCCGSPAFHSPELFLSLKSAPGVVKYWGPEVDAWCIGVSILRCLTGKRCPLGVSHTSIRHIADKVVDALLSLSSQQLRSILSGLLDMNAERRMQFLKHFEMPPSFQQHKPSRPSESQATPFKSTTFVPTAPKHRLNLRGDGSTLGISRSMSRLNLATISTNSSDDQERSRSHSTGPPSSSERQALNELVLINSDGHPFLRIVSFLKYSLRCAGILYHVWPAHFSSFAFSTPTTPLSGYHTPDPFMSTPYELRSQATTVYLRCVITLPSEESFFSSIRPPLLRSATSRSSSTPPSHNPQKHKPERKLRCLAFWMSISSVQPCQDDCPAKVSIQISDRKAMSHVRKAFVLQSPAQTPVTDVDELPQEDTSRRGREKAAKPLLSSSSESNTEQNRSINRGHEALALGIF